MAPFMSASKVIGSVISRKTGARHLINSAKSNAQLPKPDRIRRFSSIAGVETPSVCKSLLVVTIISIFQPRVCVMVLVLCKGGSFLAAEMAKRVMFCPKSMRSDVFLEQLFDMVAAVDLYHGFVPWCQRSEILRHNTDGGSFDAELDVGFKFLVESYVSHVELNRPKSVKTTVSESSLFDRLINIWEFSPGRVPGSCSPYFLVDFKYRSPLYRRDPPVAESVSTEWTDEKHSMYLKSMEASFVDQLYNSLDSLGWRLPKKKSSDITSSRQIHRTPGQFKVLRSGCWQKINFERPDSQLKKTHDPSGFLSSPWIQHYKSSCKPQTLASPSLPGTAGHKNRAVNSSGKNTVSCGSASSSEHFAACQSHSCNQDLVGRNTEVSDQNFTDEEIKSEKPRSKCSSM